MKYLITGGCGFLGSNIAARLLREGNDLCVYDNLSRLGSQQNYEWLNTIGNFKFVKNDIRIYENLEKAIIDFKPQVIFHLAGQVAMTTSIQNPRLDFETNVLGTLNVLEAIRKNCKDCAILYSSTNKVYGDLEYFNYVETDTRYYAPDYVNGFTENIQLEFHSPYGVSKGSADQYILDYSRIYGLKTTVFRHSSMYGGRQFSTTDQGWIGWFCEQALIQKENKDHYFTISGNGKQVRDLLYSDDMVDLYVTAAENIEKLNGQAFNIGGGMKNSFSLLELLNFIETEINIKLIYEKIEKRESDQKVFVADYSKVNNLLNWEPKISKEEGVKKMLDWVNKIRL
jgi:CDP-paratose 2-epimerase